MTSLHRRLRHEEEGVSLVIALLFIVVVGIFAAAALTKGAAVAGSGANIKVRTQSQYALDGAVERGMQDLVDDLATGSPAKCVDAAAGSTSGSFSLNSRSITYTCSTLAGKAAKTGDGSVSNYALAVMSSASDALTTQSGSGSDLELDGSVYLAGAVANSGIKKPISILGGDLITPTSATCTTDLSNLTKITVPSTNLRACTEQSASSVKGSVSLLTAPTASLPSTVTNGTTVNMGGGKKCQVFYPGLYTTPPQLSTSNPNYFVSGLYYFYSASSWNWQINGSDVTGGQRSVSTDSPVKADDCASMTDTTAMSNIPGGLTSAVTTDIANHRFSYGNTWVFGGTASLDMKKGNLSLFSPPKGSNTIPLSFVAATSSETSSGYVPITTGATVLSGGSNQTSTTFNGKLWAPTGVVSLFSTNNTQAAVSGGVTVYKIDLQASTAGSGGILLSASGGVSDAPPPYRTVKIVTTDTTSGDALPATNTAVISVSNFSPYTVKVYSWRTG